MFNVTSQWSQTSIKRIYILGIFPSSRRRLVTRHIRGFSYAAKFYSPMPFLTPTLLVDSSDMRGYGGWSVTPNQWSWKNDKSKPVSWGQWQPTLEIPPATASVQPCLSVPSSRHCTFEGLFEILLKISWTNSAAPLNLCLELWNQPAWLFSVWSSACVSWHWLLLCALQVVSCKSKAV